MVVAALLARRDMTFGMEREQKEVGWKFPQTLGGKEGERTMEKEKGKEVGDGLQWGEQRHGQDRLHHQHHQPQRPQIGYQHSYTHTRGFGLQGPAFQGPGPHGQNPQLPSGHHHHPVSNYQLPLPGSHQQRNHQRISTQQHQALAHQLAAPNQVYTQSHSSSYSHNQVHTHTHAYYPQPHGQLPSQNLYQPTSLSVQNPHRGGNSGIDSNAVASADPTSRTLAQNPNYYPAHQPHQPQSQPGNRGLAHPLADFNLPCAVNYQIPIGNPYQKQGLQGHLVPRFVPAPSKPLPAPQPMPAHHHYNMMPSRIVDSSAGNAQQLTPGASPHHSLLGQTPGQQQQQYGTSTIGVLEQGGIPGSDSTQTHTPFKSAAISRHNFGSLEQNSSLSSGQTPHTPSQHVALNHQNSISSEQWPSLSSSQPSCNPSQNIALDDPNVLSQRQTLQEKSPPITPTDSEIPQAFVTPQTTAINSHAHTIATTLTTGLAHIAAPPQFIHTTTTTATPQEQLPGIQGENRKTFARTYEMIHQEMMSSESEFTSFYQTDEELRAIDPRLLILDGSDGSGGFGDITPFSSAWLGLGGDGVANMMRANSPRKRRRIEEENVDPGDPWKVVGFHDPDSDPEHAIEDEFFATHASARRKLATLTESEMDALDDFQPDFWFEQSPERDQEAVEEEEEKMKRRSGVGTGRKTVRMVKKKKKEEVMGEEVMRKSVAKKDKGKGRQKEKEGEEEGEIQVEKKMNGHVKKGASRKKN